MGKAQPVELASRTFETKGEANAFFKTMLSRYSDGERIGEEDSQLLFELIQRHPDEKIGIGIAYFYKDRNPEQPTSCFHIMRTDGQPTDFSYPKCIRGTKPSADEYYYRACRFAVSPYLTEIKNDLFSREDVVRCEETGEELTKETAEYRHTDPTFKALTEHFKTETSLVISMDLFTEDRDMQYNVRFKDLTISKRFIEFHKEHAKLSMFKKRKA